MDWSHEVESVLHGSGDVSKSDYLRWATGGDLPTQARAYELSAREWSRIAPEPTMDEQCGFMAAYLLRCLVEDPPPDGFVHGGIQAGHALAAWLKHLSSVPAARRIIREVAHRMAEAYRRGSGDVQDRIETGALEHILESPLLRPYFEGWADDPVLRGAYRAAAEWGEAHTDEA